MVLELGIDLAQASTILVERLVVLDLVQVLDGIRTIGPLDVLDLDMAVQEA